MPTGRHVVTLALVTSASAFVTAGVTAALLIAHSSAPDLDTCGLPPGVTLDGLDSQERGLEVRRLLACEDLRFGRMSIEAYRAIVDGLDRAPTRPPEPPATMWASSVRGFSTQSTTSSWSANQVLGPTTSSWSANQVLGPPNVYPTHGDNQAAWASLGADDRDEWIQDGFGQPQPTSG